MSLEIKQNEPLSKHTTFAIGGPAKYFAVAKTKEEVLEAIDFAESKKLPFFCWVEGAIYCSMTTAMTA